MALATKDLEVFKERALSQGMEALSITIPRKHVDSVNFPLLDSTIRFHSWSSELDDVIRRMNSTPSVSTIGSLDECNPVLGLPAKKRKYCDNEVDATVTRSDLLNTSPRYSNIETMNNILKRECETLVRVTDDAKLWIIFSGGCDSDSSEDLISELHRAQASALNLRSAPQCDCLKRAKLCNDVTTYPGLSDYMSALWEFDEERLFLTRQRLKDLQNIYIVLVECIRQSGIVG